MASTDSSENRQLSISDLPTGAGPGKIPLSSDVLEIASTGVAVLSLTLAAVGTPQVFPHTLGRVPNVVFRSWRIGTNGASAAGSLVPGTTVVAVDATDVTITLLAATDGGSVLDLLLM